MSLFKKQFSIFEIFCVLGIYNIINYYVADFWIGLLIFGIAIFLFYFLYGLIQEFIKDIKK